MYIARAMAQILKPQRGDMCTEYMKRDVQRFIGSLNV